MLILLSLKNYLGTNPGTDWCDLCRISEWVAHELTAAYGYPAVSLRYWPYIDIESSQHGFILRREINKAIPFIQQFYKPDDIIEVEIGLNATIYLRIRTPGTPSNSGHYTEIPHQ